MAIRTYAPALSVVLTRLVNRTSSGQVVQSTDAFHTVDLTPLLGTAGTVRTIKDLNAPCGGFTLTFADRYEPSFGDSVYGIVEPGDMVEVRAARSPEKFIGTTLPLIMRGFVVSVDRAEAMSQAGKPERTVTIAGQDFGRLLAIHHVYWEYSFLLDNDYLTTFHVTASQGMTIAPVPINEFFHQLIEKVVNPKIDRINVFSDAQIKPFTVSASVPDGTAMPSLINSMDAFSLWELVALFQDAPWNEAFVMDQESGPVFVFRPVPYRDLSTNALIMPGAADPGTIPLDIVDVVAMTAARSEHQVANLFTVDASASSLDTNALLQPAALQAGIPIDFAYDANRPELFGIKRMSARSMLWHNGSAGPANALPADQQPDAANHYRTWFEQRTAELKACNRDNLSFEDTGFVVKGSEDYVIGKYLQLTRGSVVSTSYVTHVSHSIQPLSSWHTSLHTIRGDGYIQRNRSTGLPGINEGRTGPYTP